MVDDLKSPDELNREELEQLPREELIDIILTLNATRPQIVRLEQSYDKLDRELAALKRERLQLQKGAGAQRVHR